MFTLNFSGFQEKNNTQLMSVFMETDHLTKYQPSKNQSEHLELPQDLCHHIVINNYNESKLVANCIFRKHL